MTVTTKSNCDLLSLVANELEALKCVPLHLHEFPSACQAMMYTLPGNLNCVDCGAPRPRWASVTYGVLMCVQCSGRHRSYGVGISKVRSVDMDAWSHDQILAMLEGGNDQLSGFYERHRMGNNIENMANQRYRTKAALFYSTHLKRHVDDIVSSGLSYQGRDAMRRRNSASTQQQQQPQSTEREQPPAQTPPPMGSKQLVANCDQRQFHHHQHHHQQPATMEAVRPKRTRKLPTATITRHMQ